jgi:hypothetical protein
MYENSIMKLIKLAEKRMGGGYKRLIRGGECD